MYDYSWIDAIYSNGGGIFNGSGTSCNITNPSVEDAILFARNIYQLSGRQSPTSEDFDKGNIAFRPVLFLNFVHINHIRGESINILILNGIVFHFQKDRMVKICQKQRQC